MAMLNTSTIIEKAKEFAHTLASTKEFRDFQVAQRNLERDSEAHRLMQEFRKKQRELQEARMGGRFLSGDAIGDINRLRKMLMSNSTMGEYTRSQQLAIGLIQDANSAISEALGMDFGRNSSAGGPC